MPEKGNIEILTKEELNVACNYDTDYDAFIDYEKQFEEDKEK